MDAKLVVFICTANMCRSPMAEYLFNKRVGDGAPWHACSAGVMSMDGAPASRGAVEVMLEKGVDLTRHRSQELTRELAETAELLVVMTASHRAQIAATFRSEAIMDKVFLLKSFGASRKDEDVTDPVGAATSFYRKIRDEIDEAMPGLIDYLKSIDSESQSTSKGLSA